MPPKPRSDKTVEEKYKKVTQLEHVLLRPDTYVGSIEKTTEKIHVMNHRAKIMEQKMINYVPALYKIFDEILVNAADNYQRDKKMDAIWVWINKEEGYVRIKNNGATLPVEIHKGEKMYVPEMVFGHLLTSDNYDDDEKKVVGGRNGFGAKLANIFSSRMEIECSDFKKKKLYKQTFENNMQKKEKAVITPMTDKDNSYTQVTFWPDFQRFGMKRFDSDIIQLMERRVYDIAGSTSEKVKVYYNDELLPVTGFKEYVDLYLPGGDDDDPVGMDSDEGAEKEGVGEDWREVGSAGVVCSRLTAVLVVRGIDKEF